MERGGSALLRRGGGEVRAGLPGLFHVQMTAKSQRLFVGEKGDGFPRCLLCWAVVGEGICVLLGVPEATSYRVAPMQEAAVI